MSGHSKWHNIRVRKMASDAKKGKAYTKYARLIEIAAREILKTRSQLNKIYAERTGQALAKIEADMERDFYMTADEAKEYGLIDAVISKRP